MESLPRKTSDWRVQGSLGLGKSMQSSKGMLFEPQIPKSIQPQHIVDILHDISTCFIDIMLF